MLRSARGKQKKKAVLGKEQRQTEITVPKASKRVVRISEVVTVGDLARNMGVKAGEVIKKLISLGVMATDQPNPRFRHRVVSRRRFRSYGRERCVRRRVGVGSRA